MSIGLYIHFPFCLSKCFYCSFNSQPYNPDLARRYIEAIKREMTLRARNYGLENSPLKTIYLGGGTPSILSHQVIKEIIDISTNIFKLKEGIEVTIEANPDTLDRTKLEDLMRIGINRISIGVQSLSDKYLKATGRSHDADTARHIINTCRSVGFKNISLDLIYALPGQRLDEWLITVEEAISLSPNHLSIYGLTIDKGTIFYNRLKYGQIKIAPEEDQIDMYLTAVNMLKKAGYVHYEISNFSQPGYACKNNMLYWDRGEYLGIGAGAHSYIGNKRFSNTDSIEDYISEAGSGDIHSKIEELTREDRVVDAIIFGIRKIEGIDLDDIGRRYGIDPFLMFESTIDRLISAGTIILSSNRIKLTTKGILLADQVAIEFLSAGSYQTIATKSVEGE